MLKTSALHAAILLGLLSVPTAAQTYVGYVLEVEGAWHLNDDRAATLRSGQKLPAFGAISTRSPSPATRIVIANMRGEVIASRNCAVDDCSKYFNLPRESPRGSALGAVFGAAMEFVWGSPWRYSVHRGRGIQMADGVAKLEGRVLNLPPLLATAGGGYYARWRALPPGGAAGRWSRPSALEARAGGGVLRTGALKPGLYEFALLTTDGGRFKPSGVPAFVLVAPPNRFDGALASFQEATELTRGWGDKVTSKTKQQYLRAHLDWLARQGAKRVR